MHFQLILTNLRKVQFLPMLHHRLAYAQHKFHCANMTGKSLRRWKTNRITPTYLILYVENPPNCVNYRTWYDSYVLSTRSNLTCVYLTRCDMCLFECPYFNHKPCNTLTQIQALEEFHLRATSHTNQEPWPWNCESAKDSVPRPSQLTSKIM